MTESHSTTGSADTGTDGAGQRPEPDIDTHTDDLTRDDVFHILQSQRRRRVLAYIREYGDDGYARMSDVAEHIAALEHDTTVDGLRSQQRQRVYIALYQSHLPKMDEVGVVEYDQDRGHVQTTDHADRFDEYLGCESVRLGDDGSGPDVADDAGQSDRTSGTARSQAETATDWHLRYLFASGGCFLTIAAVSSGPLSDSLLSGANVGVVVAMVFTLLAVSHWVTESS
ncbi:hypothetical protein [Haloarcula sp. JP-L23]|uniref:DUF7344 domain-containing protein n=1 Tax=Haloarcula sp. JP-L23 TaxID=2716717 RepID=UPI00140F380A|nr:hypothetical protein G9465_20790 [Haloarcula sp. JP-L23]